MQLPTDAEKTAPPAKAHKEPPAKEPKGPPAKEPKMEGPNEETLGDDVA